MKTSGIGKFSLKIPNRPWAESHGVYDNKIGASLLYLGLFFAQECKNALVIGSGAGFVPELLLRNVPLNSHITLVDALLPDSGSGSPYDYENATELYEFNSKNFQYIESLSEDFFEYCKLEKIYYDFIFIDGDHSENGFTKDLLGALEIVTGGGLILFHDSRQSSVSNIANKILINWIEIPVGTGIGLYVATTGKENQMLIRPINKIAREMLLKSSYGKRWDYLRSNTFNDRLNKYWNLIEKTIDMSLVQKVMEIGGNPTPMVVKVKKSHPHLIFTAVEPFISPSASRVYEEAKKAGLIITNSIPIYIKQDLVFFLGVDLSICRTFKEFRSDVLKLRQIFSGAQFVILECADYEPSKWLIQIFAADLNLVSSYNFIFQDVSGISLDGYILNRNLYIFKIIPIPTNDLTVEQEDFIEKYALHFNMSGTPVKVTNSKSFLFGDTHQTVKNFNCWPIERNMETGQLFTWLRPSQILKFPRGTKTLEFQLYSHHKSRKIKSIGFIIEVSASKLVIRKSVFGNFFNQIYFEYFVPKSVSRKSTDSRQLSFAVTSFKFE